MCIKFTYKGLNLKPHKNILHCNSAKGVCVIRKTMDCAVSRYAYGNFSHTVVLLPTIKMNVDYCKICDVFIPQFHEDPTIEYFVS